MSTPILCAYCKPAKPAIPGFKACPDCRAIRNKRNREQAKIRRDKLLARGLCSQCGKAPPATESVCYCEKCLAYWRAYNKRADRTKKHAYAIRYKEGLLAKIVAGYGGRCACCGESNPMFLTIDHINNDGAKHRKGVGQNTIYKRLIDAGFPPEYRLLCFNCNCGRYYRGAGICPHVLAATNTKPMGKRRQFISLAS